MPDLEAIEVDVPPALLAQVAARSASDPASIGAATGEAFGRLMTLVCGEGLTGIGPPRSIYLEGGPEGMSFVVAMPVAAPPARAVDPARGKVEQVAGGRALRFLHRGPYANLRTTYEQIGELLKQRGLLRDDSDWARFMPMWEEYLNDPQSTPEAELLTHIYLPLA